MVKIARLPVGFEEPVARLIHRSLVRWYERNLGQGGRFGDRHEPFLLFPRVYEALDPGEALAAFEGEEISEEGLVGVCFVHERETHVSLGIVATDPDKAGRGAARAMMEAALERADRLGKPVRLVSSLLNLDSFSLYSRCGFSPRAIYQDLAIGVPEGGLLGEAPPLASEVRLARLDEAAKLADFECSLQGIRREKDYRFFLGGGVGDWRVWMLEGRDCGVRGVLVASEHPDWGMLGPGVAADGEAAFALIWRALEASPGRMRVVLIPSSEGNLVRRLYGLGARNIELHVAQVRGGGAEARGVSIPSFLPESA